MADALAIVKILTVIGSYALIAGYVLGVVIGATL